VTVPALKGCWTQGETVPECLDNAREAIRGFVTSFEKHGETLPPDVTTFPFELDDALDALVYRVTVAQEEAVAVA
jgi:antitoxin HicB